MVTVDPEGRTLKLFLRTKAGTCLRRLEYFCYQRGKDTVIKVLQYLRHTCIKFHEEMCFTYDH